MNTKVIAIILAACSLEACALDAREGDDAQAIEDEIRSFGGVELKGTGDNASLTIVASMKKDDVASMTAYLKKVKVARAGEGSFDAYCGLGGKVGDGTREATLTCTKYTSSVSDAQSLDFKLVERNGASYALEGVELHGTHLTRERDLLTGGEGAASFELARGRSSTDAFKNPFAATGKAANALAPLVGTKAYSEAANAELAISSFEFSVNEYYSTWAYISFAGQSSRAYAKFEMVKRAFHPEDGFVTKAELAKRAKDAMPKAPVCQSGATGTVANPVPAIENAFSPLGGPAFGLAHEVELADVPAAARAALERAADEIRARSFEGTDYTADVAGYYAIQASCSDSTVVAYVVWGTGSGEPDYHDGIVVGVSVSGQRVYDNEEDG